MAHFRSICPIFYGPMVDIRRVERGMNRKFLKKYVMKHCETRIQVDNVWQLAVIRAFHRMLYFSVPVCFLVIGAAICAPERVQSEHDPHDSQEAQDPLQEPLGHVEKRARNYNFGLGKRAYSYVSEYKRLPVYNFGLGKRSRPYSFGLGKRSIDADTAEDQPSNEIDQQNLNELFEQYDDTPAYEKRARPYSFGLGKRFVPEENEDKRGQRTYDFGLGKRLPYYDFGLGKRARSYNFGLGKRLSKFNFGLGKRERDMHRFSFGLGKRSEDATIDDSVNYYEE